MEALSQATLSCTSRRFLAKIEGGGLVAPLFSVIVPAYNREHLLAATIRSVLSQRFKDYELIVVDDGSTDGTARVAAGFGEQIQLVRLPHNTGLCGARNAGLAAAAGKYCAMLDSDDLWAPWTLECYRRAITEAQGPAMVTCDGMFGIHGDAEMNRLAEAPFTTERFRDFLSYRCLRPEFLLLLTGTVIRRDLLRDIGGFRERFRMCFEEQDLCMRMGTAPGLVRITQPLCWGYRDHPGNISKDMARLLAGGFELMHAEQRGEYPGGPQRRWDRRRAITTVTRYLARTALERGHVAQGWSMYAETWRWNLHLARIRFLAVYPVLAAAAFAKPLLRGSSMLPEKVGYGRA